VTSPPELTVAMPVLVLSHAVGRPINTVPPSDRAVAVSCRVPPTNKEAVSGATVTVATGTAETDTVALPTRPSLVADIVVLPGLIAVTRPPELTLAITVSELDHVIVRPGRSVPSSDLAVALSCEVAPTTMEDS
jgi:hypothetical protein